MIYLIDDDKSIRRAFGVFLRSAGMEYTSCESANEFLSVFKPETGDVIVLDLHLPGMNGLELLERFEKGGIHIPVIVVTAFDDPPSRESCREYGVKAYLRKPVDGEALIDLLMSV